MDSGYGAQFIGVQSENENDAETDLKRILEHGHERVVCHIPRKPAGVDWSNNYRSQPWAIGGLAKDRR